jgi:hypothetical protein
MTILSLAGTLLIFDAIIGGDYSLKSGLTLDLVTVLVIILTRLPDGVTLISSVIFFTTDFTE